MFLAITSSVVVSRPY